MTTIEQTHIFVAKTARCNVHIATKMWYWLLLTTVVTIVHEGGEETGSDNGTISAVFES